MHDLYVCWGSRSCSDERELFIRNSLDRQLLHHLLPFLTLLFRRIFLFDLDRDCFFLHRFAFVGFLFGIRLAFGK